MSCRRSNLPDSANHSMDRPRNGEVLLRQDTIHNGIKVLGHEMDVNRRCLHFYPNRCMLPAECSCGTGSLPTTHTIDKMKLPDRDEARKLLAEYTKSPSLLNHSVAVEAVLGAYARRRSVLDVTVRSIKKKWKQRSFAEGVSREDIALGAGELDVDLDEHIATVLEALQGSAAEIGLVRENRQRRKAQLTG